MIEVFQTNVQESAQAQKLVDLLLRHFPGSRINFDLDDCDRVLRVEGQHFMAEDVTLLMKNNGFHCRVLN